MNLDFLIIGQLLLISNRTVTKQNKNIFIRNSNALKNVLILQELFQRYQNVPFQHFLLNYLSEFLLLFKLMCNLYNKNQTVQIWNMYLVLKLFSLRNLLRIFSFKLKNKKKKIPIRFCKLKILYSTKFFSPSITTF